MADAIRSGVVTDYRDSRYWNVKLMSEQQQHELAPPHVEWARELIAAKITTVHA